MANASGFRTRATIGQHSRSVSGERLAGRTLRIRREPDAEVGLLGDAMSVIVVIDGEPVVRSVVTQILERDGHEVRAAAEFQSGLAMIKDFQPALVMTNVLLPDMTGHHAMCKLRP